MIEFFIGNETENRKEHKPWLKVCITPSNRFMFWDVTIARHIREEGWMFVRYECYFTFWRAMRKAEEIGHFESNRLWAEYNRHAVDIPLE